MSKLGTNIGMIFAIAAFGVLVGNPISGAILGHSGQYVGLQAFSGAIVFLAALFFAAARIAKAGVGLRRI